MKSIMGREILGAFGGQKRLLALLVLVFSLPLALGDIGTAVILIIGTTCVSAVFGHTRFADRPRSLVVSVFAIVFITLAVAFTITARVPYDIVFALNFYPLLAAIPAFWVAGSAPRKNPMQVISTLSLIGSAMSPVIGAIAMFAFDQGRVGYHVVNPIHYGNISVLLGFVAVSGVFCTKSPWRFFYLIGPFFGLAGVVFSGSRGPLVSFFALAVLTWAFWFFVEKRLRLYLFILSAVAVLAGGVAMTMMADVIGAGRLMSLYGHAASFLATGVIEDASINVRLQLYAGGIEAFVKSPWAGHGWANLIESVRPFVDEDVSSYIVNFNHLHSDIMDFAVSAGIFGLICYAAMIVSPVISVCNSDRDSGYISRLYAVSALFVLFLFSGMTNLLIGHGLQTTLFCFMAVLIIGYGTDKPQKGLPAR